MLCKRLFKKKLLKNKICIIKVEPWLQTHFLCVSVVESNCVQNILYT